MRFLSYDDRNGRSWGVLADDGIIPASAFAAECDTLRAALARHGIAALAAAAAGIAASVPRTSVRLLPVIPDASHVLCLGHNYGAHSRESGKETPAYPRVFLRANSSLAAPDGVLLRPACSREFDYEGELAAIIGRAGRHIRPEDAMDHVAGLTCFIDGSLRDFQKHSVTAGKNFPQTGALGPYLVTLDESGPWDALTLVTELNGEIVQSAPTAEMIVGLPDIIAYLSSFIQLQPGDVIATGTPAGVGAHRDPKRWLEPGDQLRVMLSGVATLSVTIADEPSADAGAAL